MPGGMLITALVIVTAIGGASALLYRMAMEKERLWRRYEQLKADLKRQDEARRRREQQARLAIKEARRANLAAQPMDEDEMAKIPSVPVANGK